jgi:hypothetical protein
MFISLPVIIPIAMTILAIGAWLGYQEREREFEAALRPDERADLRRSAMLGQKRETFAALRWRRTKSPA